MSLHKPEDDDQEIVRQACSGDTNAFEKLLTRHKRHVGAIAAAHVPASQVEDIAQEVFIKLYLGLSKIREKGSVKGWLAAVTIRTCYDFWRKQYRRNEIAESSLTTDQRNWIEQVISDETGQRLAEQREARQVLEAVLQKFGPEDRMVMELVYFQGYSVKETAGLLGWSRANVKIRTFRARKKLKKILAALREGINQ